MAIDKEDDREPCDECSELVHSVHHSRLEKLCPRHRHEPLRSMTESPMDTTWFLALKHHTPYVIRSFDYCNHLCDCEWVTPDGQTKYHWDTFDGWLPLPEAMKPSQEED